MTTAPPATRHASPAGRLDVPDARFHCRWLVAMLMACLPMVVTAQDVSAEYRRKAAYLYGFAKFVEWPATAQDGPLTICLAGRNPFGTALEDAVRHETVDGHRRFAVRVILAPASGCHVLFIPNRSATSAYLRAARGQPVLTVGESPDFLRRGGVITFLLERNDVRFAIDNAGAERHNLRISSRLRRLAIDVPGQGE